MLIEALRVMGVGMGTVFGLLLVLFGVTVLLMRIKERKSDTEQK